MRMVRWRKAAADGSVWVADPEPDYHLSVWQASSGCIGWDWQVLDRTGNVLARDWGVQAADDAKAKAEAWYLVRRAQVAKQRR
jgi:hypothetical protein